MVHFQRSSTTQKVPIRRKMRCVHYSLRNEIWIQTSSNSHCDKASNRAILRDSDVFGDLSVLYCRLKPTLFDVGKEKPQRLAWVQWDSGSERSLQRTCAYYTVSHDKSSRSGFQLSVVKPKQKLTTANHKDKTVNQLKLELIICSWDESTGYACDWWLNEKVARVFEPIVSLSWCKPIYDFCFRHERKRLWAWWLVLVK